MHKRLTRTLTALAAFAALAVGGAAISGAATSTTTTGTSTSATSTASSAASGGGPPGGFTAANAPGTAAHEAAEKAVTGADAEKAQAAAVASVSGKAGAVTTDFRGQGYEVDVTKADGTSVSVHLDSSFKVQTHPAGHGPGMGGPGGPGGHPGQTPPYGQMPNGQTPPAG